MVDAAIRVPAAPTQARRLRDDPDRPPSLGRARSRHRRPTLSRSHRVANAVTRRPRTRPRANDDATRHIAEGRRHRVQGDTARAPDRIRRSDGGHGHAHIHPADAESTSRAAPATKATTETEIDVRARPRRRRNNSFSPLNMLFSSVLRSVLLFLFWLICSR